MFALQTLRVATMYINIQEKKEILQYAFKGLAHVKEEFVNTWIG